MRYWLLKSEPEDLSIDDLAADRLRDVPWTGVRNFQARNFMRDMRVGDLAFFYHSSCADIGIAGIVEVVSTSYPDATQFDEKSRYFDSRATAENPRWLTFDVRYVRRTRFIPLSMLRQYPQLEGMRVLAKGSRLSITPVEIAEWKFIAQLMQVEEPSPRETS
jgi:predicted RNA-binding protein with PUA-like domain